MRQCISIMMVPLDSMEKWVFLLFFAKILFLDYTTSCCFSEVVDFPARLIGLGPSRRTEFSQTSKQNPLHPCGEIFNCTSIFHEKTLCLSVLKFWDGHQTSKTLDKLARSSYASVQFILSGNWPLWRNANLYKIRTTVLPRFKKNHFPRNPVSSGTIRNQMNDLIFIWSTFEISK